MAAMLAGCRPDVPEAATDGPRVVLTTSKGTFVVALDVRSAPLTCAQFQNLADAGHYDGALINRVLKHRRIGAGGPTSIQRGRSHAVALRNEWGNGLRHTRGTIAMNRTIGDPRLLSSAQLQASINSARDEFFINLRHNTQYDRRQVDGAGYTVFGRVVAGMDVVDAIAAVAVRRDPANGEPGEPVESIQILSARSERDGPARK